MGGYADNANESLIVMPQIEDVDAARHADDIVTVPMDPGDGLFFHSLLLHGTAENMSTMPRRAITMSYMAAEYRYTGDPPKPDYLLIAGMDVR